MWQSVFTEDGGVDFFYSDSPLEAMQMRDQLQAEVAKARTIEDQVAEYIFKHPVMVFSKSYCPHSKATKDLLAKKGISHEVLELDQVENGREIQDTLKSKRFGGQSTVPNIFINGKQIGGNQELQQLAKKGLLEELLL